LVETKDLSQQLYDQLIAGADFAQLARDNSSDEGTAGNGGDLGWFPRNEMVGPFEQVAFTLPAGQISQPFESQFGWHIVKVLDPVQERPLTEEQITSIQQRLLTGWLDAKRAETRISSEFGPTPTPSGEFFEPPAEAPPAPTPTFVPEELPIASPVGTPEGVVVAEPTATPLAGP